MADKRLVLRSASVGVEDTTVDSFSKAASLVGAPKNARISTGGTLYNPDTGESDTNYPSSVTFSWVEEV